MHPFHSFLSKHPFSNQEIHKYMRGETKSDLIHSTLSDVVSLGIKHLEMRDEILCQLCRLMTDNPGGETPLYRLWVLMLLCLLAFHPSKSLHKVGLLWCRCG